MLTFSVARTSYAGNGSRCGVSSMVEGHILMRGRRVLFVDDDRFISRAQQLLARASFAIGSRWLVPSAAASARRRER